MIVAKFANLDSYKNLNSANKETVATPTDIYNIMTDAVRDDADWDAFLGEAMAQSASMFVLLTQVRAMRALFLFPDAYAGKLVSDTPLATAFKANKSLAGLQAMLNGLTTVAPTALPGEARRNLSAQLCNPHFFILHQASWLQIKIY